MSYDFAGSAQQAYVNLKRRFTSGDDSDNYWRLGNAFDTATDYLLMAWDKHSDPEMAGIAYERYQKTSTTSTCWYDDYAWWGIASTKAYDKNYDGIFGKHLDDFKKVALDWRRRGHTDRS